MTCQKQTAARRANWPSDHHLTREFVLSAAKSTCKLAFWLSVAFLLLTVSMLSFPDDNVFLLCFDRKNAVCKFTNLSFQWINVLCIMRVNYTMRSEKRYLLFFTLSRSIDSLRIMDVETDRLCSDRRHLVAKAICVSTCRGSLNDMCCSRLSSTTLYNLIARVGDLFKV